MIRVKDNYYIDADDSSFCIKKKMENLDKNGNSVYRIEGYYTSIEGSLRGLMKKLQRNIARGKDISLVEAYKKFDALMDEFDQLINTIGRELK